MRRLALLLLIVLLAACGGGSGSGDGDDGSDSGGNTGGGAAAAAATSTPGDGDAEDDSGAEATSAAEPAPEAKTDVEPMPEPEGAAGVRPLLTATFDEALSSPFLVDKFENGAVTEVLGGAYHVTPADGKTQIMLPKSIPAVNNGIIDVIASVEGNGAAGVSVRTRKDPQGTFSGYVCWISEPAGAGCSTNSKDTYTLLFSAPEGSITLQTNNELRVAMIGDILQFEVNGQVIGQVAHTGAVSGNWGLYAESASGGTATATFGEVVIYRSTGAYELP